MSLNPLFSGSLIFLGSFVKFTQVPGSAVTAQGLFANRSLGGEKMVQCIVCFAYSLLSLLLV